MTPARRLWTLFEPLHAVTYFAPEGRAAFEAAGLRGFWRGYFASRSAPLGHTPAAVTTALYANFAPRMVERAIPSVWELAAPEQALAARLEGSVAALSRLLDGGPVEESASLLQTVADLAPTTGRALGAANAALPWPDEPLAVLWQAATVLRELRGDGHVLAQLAVGLDGLSTMVLRAGHDLSRDALQPNRGWTDDEWSASAAALTDRGLLGPDGLITPAGVAHAARRRDPHRRAGPGALDTGRPAGRRAVRRARRPPGRCRADRAATGQPDRSAGPRSEGLTRSPRAAQAFVTASARAAPAGSPARSWSGRPRSSCGPRSRGATAARAPRPRRRGRASASRVHLGS